MSSRTLIRSAAEIPLTEVVNLFGASFSDYFVPILPSVRGLADRIRVENVDIAESRVLEVDGRPAAFALIAIRGQRNRIAAMGTRPEYRGRGFGRFLLAGLVEEAARRGARELLLEVIDRNEAAIRLYRGAGFESIGRLAGWALDDRRNEPPFVEEPLTPIPLSEAAHAMAQHGIENLPWQLEPTTISASAPPTAALRLGEAIGVVADPTAETMILRCLVVPAEARRNGAARTFLAALRCAFPRRLWRMPAIVPEEIGKPLLTPLGFQREELGQFQMRLIPELRQEAGKKN